MADLRERLQLGLVEELHRIAVMGFGVMDDLRQLGVDTGRLTVRTLAEQVLIQQAATQVLPAGGVVQVMVVTVGAEMTQTVLLTGMLSTTAAGRDRLATASNATGA